MSDASPGPARVRLDRWLWAARFFKTRAQAKAAIEGGKVHVHVPDARAASDIDRLQKPKVSKEVAVGDRLSIRRGITPEVIDVIALSGQRGGAPQARLLYTETPESIEAREVERSKRSMERAGLHVPAARPNKRDRRELMKLKDGQGEPLDD